MKKTEFSLSLNLLKHQIAKNLSIMKRPSFTFARLVKTSHSDGFTRRVELYIKHMLSFSIFLKNKEVLVSNDWENGKKDKSLYGSKSLLNMRLSLHLCDYLGWVICLMIIIPMVYHTIHHFGFGSMLPIHSVSLTCSREVTP